jgi:hypothetical protein
MEEESVGQRFSQLIQQLGMSKNAFAMSLDKTATVIQHLVDERNKPGFDLMCKVFEVYPNVSKDWLLMGQGPMLLNGSPAATPVATPTVASPSMVAPPPAPATPSFPAPLFTVSAARQAEPELPALPALPAEPLVATPPPTSPVASLAGASPVVAAPVAPSPLPAAAPAAAPPDAAALTAALHAQYLQHQLALAEQRNQHLLAQQQLMQQMLDLLRPAHTAS